MSYFFTKVSDLTYEEALVKVTEELKKEGFGVLTEIDIKETLKKKLDVDFRKYKILGACNPPFAYKALQAEEKIGLLLPCNIVVQENSKGETEVSAINPLVSMQSVNNSNLSDVANEVKERLERVINNI